MAISPAQREANGPVGKAAERFGGALRGFASGSLAHGTCGRRPGHSRFGHEARSADETTAHRPWRNEFEELFGAQRRGLGPAFSAGELTGVTR